MLILDISTNCPKISKTNNCLSNMSVICQNHGKCIQDYNSNKCDCFDTLFDGPTCSKSNKKKP